MRREELAGSCGVLVKAQGRRGELGRQCLRLEPSRAPGPICRYLLPTPNKSPGRCRGFQVQVREAISNGRRSRRRGS